MMAPHTVDCELDLSSSADGGLRRPLPVPTPSLLLMFPNLDPGDSRDDIQIGALINSPAALAPGSLAEARLTFWADLGRIYAVPSAGFRLWYAGRIVGSGRVLKEARDEER